MNEETKIKNKLVLSFLYDLQKPNIDKYERAILIKDYMETNKLTMRGLSKKLHIPLTTLHTWLLYNHMPPGEHKRLREEGLSETDINTILKSRTKDFGEAIRDIQHYKGERMYIYFEEQLDKMTKLSNKVKGMINNNNKIRPETIEKVKDLIKELNYLLFVDEKKNGKK